MRIRTIIFNSINFQKIRISSEIFVVRRNFKKSYLLFYILKNEKNIKKAKVCQKMYINFKILSKLIYFFKLNFEFIKITCNNTQTNKHPIGKKNSNFPTLKITLTKVQNS